MIYKYIIDGARKDNGEEQQIIVEAGDAAQAEEIASTRGLFVSAVNLDTSHQKSHSENAGRNSITDVDQRRPAANSPEKLVCGIIIALIGLGCIGALSYTLSGAPSGTKSRAAADSIENTELTYTDRYFWDALKSRDMNSVKRALQDEPNLNAANPKSGETPLFTVMRNIDYFSSYISKSRRRELKRWQEFAEILLKADADINATDNIGKTLLHQASTPWTINFLLKHNAHIDGSADSVSRVVGTPLHGKCSDVWYEEAALLLSRGANPNLPRYDGQTPLHKAAAANQVKIVSLLIKSGAEINSRDKKGYTPLKRAELSYQKEAAGLLKRSGATE